MNNVTLKKIDQTNFAACFNLQLREEQAQFVSHPIRSLAQAYVYYNQCTPLGIYANAELVGYVMVIYDYEEATYNMWHLMIDSRQQGKGYGKQALQCVMEYIATKPFGNSNIVLITCAPQNTIAAHLYNAYGFVPTGRRDEEEIELSFTIKN
ncbi:MAG: GNAT family N-acetyltransferase [Oscillospiraceae bacterium]|nr:GNAT family N-acetyltransferase [Oscillospiraceae bacterium]